MMSNRAIFLKKALETTLKKKKKTKKKTKKKEVVVVRRKKKNDGRVPRGLLRASGERGAVPLPLSVQVGETIGALGVGEMSVARTRAGRWRMGRAADGTGETNETTTTGDQQRRGKRGRGEREDEVNTTTLDDDDDAKKNAFFL